MVYAFLIKLKFYKEKHVIAFYILAFIIVLFRIAELVLVGELIFNTFPRVVRYRINDWANYFYYTNTYLKVILGLVQVEKMTSITSEIKALETEK